MQLVGLSGYARTGKDTVAKILTDDHGLERRAFADRLRDALYALDPMIGGIVPHDGSETNPVRYAHLIDTCGGYESARQTLYAPEIRRLLQRLGTEVGRRILGEDVWVNLALADLGAEGRYVFSDVRFINEARAVVERGGQVWRVHRPGVGPANDHISEVGLDDWPYDRHVHNAGTLHELEAVVTSALVGDPAESCSLSAPTASSAVGHPG